MQLLVQLVDQATADAQRDPVSKVDLGGAVKAVCELVRGPNEGLGLRVGLLPSPLHCRSPSAQVRGPTKP